MSTPTQPTLEDEYLLDPSEDHTFSVPPALPSAGATLESFAGPSAPFASPPNYDRFGHPAQIRLINCNDAEISERLLHFRFSQQALTRQPTPQLLALFSNTENVTATELYFKLPTTGQTRRLIDGYNHIYYPPQPPGRPPVWPCDVHQRLEKAAGAGDMGATRFFLRCEGDPRRAMQAAAMGGRGRIVEFLANEGFNFWSAGLEYAAMGNQMGLIAYFLKRTSCKGKVLIGAARGGHLQLAKAYVDRADQVTKNQALLEALSHDHLELARCLVEWGANCWSRALLASVELGDVSAVRYFIQRGADTQSDIEDGLLAALRGGHRQLVRGFLRMGACNWRAALATSREVRWLEAERFFASKLSRCVVSE